MYVIGRIYRRCNEISMFTENKRMIKADRTGTYRKTLRAAGGCPSGHLVIAHPWQFIISFPSSGLKIAILLWMGPVNGKSWGMLSPFAANGRLLGKLNNRAKRDRFKPSDKHQEEDFNFLSFLLPALFRCACPFSRGTNYIVRGLRF